MSRQVRKNLVGLLAVGAATAGLGLYAYYGVFKADEAKSAADEVAAQLVPGVKDLSAFKKLVVTSQGETTTVVRDGEHWKITSPVSAPADDAAVSGLLSAIQSAKLTQVDEHPSADDVKKYGLEHPEFTVAVDAAGQTVTFSGGVVNSYDNTEYLTRQGSSAVFLTPMALGDAARKKTFDLRDKRLLTLAPDDVKQIELGPSIVIDRDAQKHWQMVKPTSEPADEDVVNGLISAVTSAHVTAFLVPPKSLNAFSNEIAFTVASGKRIQLTLGVQDGHTYGFINDGQGLTEAEIGHSVLDALNKEPADFKDRTVLRFDDKLVAKASFTPTGGGEAITVERSKPGSEDWMVTAPKKGAAKQWSLSTILWALHSLKAAQFGPTSASANELAKLGLDAKSQAVTLFDDKGGTVATLQLGNAVADQRGQLWARNASGAVFAIDGSKLSALPQSVDALLAPPAKAAAK